MLSRRTVLLALVPSLVAGLAAGLANDACVHLAPAYVAILVGYWAGVLVGLGLASRYGGLSKPYGPRA